MTEQEVILMANESGLTYYGMGKDRARFIYHLEKFAALVEAAARADERKLCTAVVRQRDDLVRTLEKAEAHIKFLEDEIRTRGLL